MKKQTKLIISSLFAVVMLLICSKNVQANYRIEDMDI